MRVLLLLLAAMTSTVALGSTLSLGNKELELRAQARACYLGFIKIYDVDYFADDTAARCVRVSYLRGFSADELGEATVKVFAKRHGEDTARRYEDLLSELNAAYEPVDNGDTYTYCVAPNTGGLLMRDGNTVKQIHSEDFAERFLRIWIKGEQTRGEPEWAFGTC